MNPNLNELADQMRAAGVRRVEFSDGSLSAVELADHPSFDPAPAAVDAEDEDPGDPDLCPACHVKKPEGIWKPMCRSCGRKVARV